MQTMSRLFLACFFCLVLPPLNGCSKKSKSAMIDAANKLIAAKAVTDQERQALVDKFQNHDDIFPEELREALATFKTKVNEISLTACSGEFKDAFATWEQAIIAEREFFFEVFGAVQSTAHFPVAMETELLRLVQQGKDAETRFKTLCRKMELNVQFEDRVADIDFNDVLAHRANLRQDEAIAILADEAERNYEAVLAARANRLRDSEFQDIRQQVFAQPPLSEIFKPEVGLGEEIQLIGNMNPDQAKEVIRHLWLEDRQRVLQILIGMEEISRQKILYAMRESNDKEFQDICEILQRISDGEPMTSIIKNAVEH